MLKNIQSISPGGMVDKSQFAVGELSFFHFLKETQVTKWRSSFGLLCMYHMCNMSHLLAEICIACTE